MINKQTFIKMIELIKEYTELSDTIRKASDGTISVNYDAYEAALVNLLEIVFNDKSDWISYFLYELDFGKRYKDGMITDNDQNVKLATPEDLYNLLVENNKE